MKHKSDAPGEPVSAALIERWALAYLERFPSSAANLRRVLMRRVRRLEIEDQGPARAAIDTVAEKLRRLGAIDDVAYAAARTRTRLRRGQSLRTIRAGLAEKGVAPGDMEAAFAGIGNEEGNLDLAAAVAFARRRRLGVFRRQAADRAKELAAFARAGFSRGVAEAVLGCADQEAVEGLLRED
ncbi:MAG TPA: RecX family transcriptional regulator [Stellaceae bacterium]|jgi:regulatory protein